MLLRRVIEHVKAQNWTAVGLDFLIVVAGLFVGLQVDNWWEAQRNAAQERSYLVELRNDFRINMSEINRMETQATVIIEAMRLLLKESALENPSRPVPELNLAFRELTQMLGFYPVSRTYDNLVGSGELKLIRNQALQSAIADFNRQHGITTLVLNTHELELVGTFDPYIIENLDYQAVAIDRVDGAFPLPPPNDPDRILAVLGTQEFRNVVTLKWVITTDLLNQFQELETDVATILAILDSELGDTAERSE